MKKTSEVALTRLVIIAALALALGSLAACKRSVCEPVPLEGFWKEHEELVPPGATVCRCKPAGGDETLELDFADDPNPFVTITEHMESKGFRRTDQSIDNPDIQSMMLERGKPGENFMVVGVNLHREKGRWNVLVHTPSK